MTTPVLFRAERHGKFKGDVTAVFPDQPGTHCVSTMTCYVHVGQHSSCSMDWYHTTRKAKPEEYRELLAELQQIYDGELVVRSRVTRADYLNRVRILNEIRR